MGSMKKPNDNYIMGYYNDDYDIVSNPPITKSFKQR